MMVASAPAAPPASASRVASERNCVPDLGPGGAERAPEPDLGAAFEHADDHDVGHADGADEQRDGAESEEQAVERAGCLGAGGERGGGL
jgi:hypothetical protein